MCSSESVICTGRCRVIHVSAVAGISSLGRSARKLSISIEGVSWLEYEICRKRKISGETVSEESSPKGVFARNGCPCLKHSTDLVPQHDQWPEAFGVYKPLSEPTLPSRSAVSVQQSSRASSEFRSCFPQRALRRSKPSTAHWPFLNQPASFSLQAYFPAPARNVRPLYEVLLILTQSLSQRPDP
jgi:DNA-binding CsgD family transcriptional regulator